MKQSFVKTFGTLVKEIPQPTLHYSRSRDLSIRTEYYSVQNVTQEIMGFNTTLLQLGTIHILFRHNFGLFLTHPPFQPI